MNIDQFLIIQKLFDCLFILYFSVYLILFCIDNISGGKQVNHFSLNYLILLPMNLLLVRIHQSE